ncbi:MAG: hypothetical protein VST70_02475 [Nitrospirota bacterium]|nr:hypothetical protein [Nitrospirota bacterium]
MNQIIHFTVSGNRYSISKREIEQKMRGIAPESTRKYRIAINGIDYPIKQVLESITGLSRSAFTSQEAMRVLRKFEFLISEN